MPKARGKKCVLLKELAFVHYFISMGLQRRVQRESFRQVRLGR